MSVKQATTEAAHSLATYYRKNKNLPEAFFTVGIDDINKCLIVYVDQDLGQEFPTIWEGIPVKIRKIDWPKIC